jgi:glycosyltransferase involved in cell wall biosynthesis
VAEEEEGGAGRSRDSSRLRAVRISLADPVSYTIPYDRSLAGALARRGHEVDLFTASFLFAELPLPDGYRQHDVFFTRSARVLRGNPRSRLRFLVKGLEYVPSARRLQKEIARLDPDVLHVQWLGLPRFDLRWLESVQRERPVVFTAHDVLPRRTADKLDLWRQVFSTVDRVVVHGAAAAERLAELGVDFTKIVRIPHPVFTPTREIAPPQGSTILFFGLIRRSKGLDLLVRALPAIAERVPNVRLLVAGDPIEAAEPYQALARELGIAERIDWRLRFLTEEEIADVMEEAALVALPYREIESSGVLATALGHGRPAVVTDVGSLGDIVREFEAGEVVPPEDAAALAAACSRLLLEPPGTTTKAREALTWERAAEAHERVYLELLEARG